jgi:hypothetical protein
MYVLPCLVLPCLVLPSTTLFSSLLCPSQLYFTLIRCILSHLLSICVCVCVCLCVCVFGAGLIVRCGKSVICSTYIETMRTIICSTPLTYVHKHIHVHVCHSAQHSISSTYYSFCVLLNVELKQPTTNLTSNHLHSIYLIRLL